MIQILGATPGDATVPFRGGGDGGDAGSLPSMPSTANENPRAD